MRKGDAALINTKQNLHVHSIYCDGKDTPEEMIEAAIAAGFGSLGFSIHAYMSYSTSGHLSLEKNAKYNVEIERLKQKYKDVLPIFRGVEQDLFADYPPDGYDYALASVHYLHTSDGLVSFDRDLDYVMDYVNKYFEDDGMKFAKAYYEALATAPDHGRFDIIGHFDLITKHNETRPFIDTESKEYKQYYMEAIDALAGKIPFFEVNTGAVARGYRTTPYPSLEIAKYLREKGFGATISSDCHDKRFVDHGYGDAAEFLREAGFRTKFILTENGQSGITNQDSCVPTGCGGISVIALKFKLLLIKI
jgi:histidinol-phosphatase (PHP family)